MKRFLAVATLLIPLAYGHTFHASIAQIDYISSKRVLEVIVWIHAEDLERRMQQQLGRKAKLDDSKAAERFVREYLRTHFEIKRSNGEALPQNWVGVEVRTHFIAAYFESPSPSGLADLTLSNRILLAMFPDQENVVKVKHDGKERRELTFNNRAPREPQRLLELQAR